MGVGGVGGRITVDHTAFVKAYESREIDVSVDRAKSGFMYEKPGFMPQSLRKRQANKRALGFGLMLLGLSGFFWLPWWGAVGLIIAGMACLSRAQYDSAKGVLEAALLYPHIYSAALERGVLRTVYRGGNDQGPANTRNDKAAAVVAAYGEFLEHNPTGTDIVDESRLPAPKEEILDAICHVLSAGMATTEQAGVIKACALMLADFQKGVGPEPLKPLGMTLGENSPSNMSEQELVHLAKQIAAGSHMRGTYERFNALVRADMQRIQQRLDAAYPG